MAEAGASVGWRLHVALLRTDAVRVVGSVVGTLYYPQRLFWSASLGQTEWWVMVPGLLVPLAMLWWLVRRFERAVFA